MGEQHDASRRCLGAQDFEHDSNDFVEVDLLHLGIAPLPQESHADDFCCTSKCKLISLRDQSRALTEGH